MEAYTPTGPQSILSAAAAVLVALVGGLAAARLSRPSPARLFAWAIVVGGVVFVDRATLFEGAGFRMLALCAVLLLAMKGVVSVEARAAGGSPLPLGRSLAFSLLWVGMQPRAFGEPAGRPLPGAGALLVRGFVRMAIGAALVLAARAIGRDHRLPGMILMMAGLGLLFHFGLFSVVAGLWRGRGVPCDAICQAPALSRSLSEFWGKRWNLAFSEMCTIGVYRPLGRRIGRDAAMVAVFLFSGALHEVAISLPARAGYGLPTLYFAIHGALMWLERVRERRGKAPLGRAWTLFWVLAPTPVLFHSAFLVGVVAPLVTPGP